MRPKNLQEWTLDFIIDLLRRGYNEDVWFDFKETLPNSKDEKAKDRLRRAVASFANNEGGFIIFGISDNKEQKPEDRLFGVSPKEDYPVLFGNLLDVIIPRPDFNFKNPPITLPSGKLIHICEILESMDKPVSVETAEGLFIFPMRTPKGATPMRYDEIKQNFLGYAHMRDKLLLLNEELKRIIMELKIYEGANNLSASGRTSGHTIENETLSLCVSSSYGLLKKNPALINKLNDIKTRISLINGVVKYNLSFFIPDSIGRQRLIAKANQELASSASDLIRSINDCLGDLGNFIEKL